MFDNLTFLARVTAWPLLLLLAWWLGDRLYGRWSVPRPTTYVAVGLLGGVFPGALHETGLPSLPFLANLALALVLCELGYRINLRWFRHNPWIAVTGVLAALLVMGGTWWVTGWFDITAEVRWVIATVAMAASPAGVILVTHECRSAGQVTDRVLHQSAIGCLMSATGLKLVVGYWHLSTSGDGLAAAVGSVHSLLGSLALGGLLGLGMPYLLAGVQRDRRAATVAFTLAVVLLSTVAYGLQLSPLLAALAFGLVARERRVQLSSAQRGFGSVGALTGLFLFVYVGSLVNWPAAWSSLVLAAGLLLVRVGATVGVNTALARVSGVTWRKGMWTGLAMAPMSAYAILLLEQTRQQGLLPAAEALVVMAGLVVVLELLGPVLTQRALVAARESQPRRNDRAAQP